MKKVLDRWSFSMPRPLQKDSRRKHCASVRKMSKSTAESGERETFHPGGSRSADPLQCRRIGHGRVRDGSGGHPSRPGRREAVSRFCRRRRGLCSREARLTAWELVQAKIPVTVLTDNMAAWLMRSGKISLVIVGADRIAGNGERPTRSGRTALRFFAKWHRISFLCGSPDLNPRSFTRFGKDIPIEGEVPGRK